MDFDLKVTFYLNTELDVESIEIKSSKHGEPIEFLSRVEQSIVDNLPETIEKEHYYSAKLKRIYEPDGSGASRFDGYDLVHLRCRTRFI